MRRDVFKHRRGVSTTVPHCRCACAHCARDHGLVSETPGGQSSSQTDRDVPRSRARRIGFVTTRRVRLIRVCVHVTSMDRKFFFNCCCFIEVPKSFFLLSIYSYRTQIKPTIPTRKSSEDGNFCRCGCDDQ